MPFLHGLQVHSWLLEPSQVGHQSNAETMDQGITWRRNRKKKQKTKKKTRLGRCALHHIHTYIHSAVQVNKSPNFCKSTKSYLGNDKYIHNIPFQAASCMHNAWRTLDSSLSNLHFVDFICSLAVVGMQCSMNSVLCVFCTHVKPMYICTCASSYRLHGSDQ